MVDESVAIQIRLHVLSALRELNSIAAISMDWETPEAKQLKKAVGLAIGQIDLEILGPIYSKFPDLDDLKGFDFSQFDELFKR